MIIISAMSKDYVIGSGDGMPWSVPEEYEQFLRFVDGQAIIMGRRSFEIFGPDLKSSANIVVSRSTGAIEGALVCGSIDEAVEKATSLGKTVFSAGGATMYEQTLPLASDMYLSFIKGDFSGDTYFPAFDEADWDIIERRDHAAFEFVHYRRKG
ncbi:MAG: dihydrofolate reductase [Candidatus Latescibacterota bacterium]